MRDAIEIHFGGSYIRSCDMRQRKRWHLRSGTIPIGADAQGAAESSRYVLASIQIIVLGALTYAAPDSKLSMPALYRGELQKLLQGADIAALQRNQVTR